MKTLQLARAGRQLLCCCCQILAGLANMNLQSSDSALILWLNIWSSGWPGSLCSSHSFLEAGLGRLRSFCGKKWPCCMGCCNVEQSLFLWHNFSFLTYDTVKILLFLNLNHAITCDKYRVLILNRVSSQTLRSQMCCHGAELLLPSQLLIRVRSPPRLK